MVAKSSSTPAPQRATPVTPESASTIPVDTIRPTAIHFANTVMVVLRQTTLHRPKGYTNPLRDKSSATFTLPAAGKSILKNSQHPPVDYPIRQWGLHGDDNADQELILGSALGKNYFLFPTNLHCFRPTSIRNCDGERLDPIGTTHLRKDTMSPFESVVITDMPLPRPELKGYKKYQLYSDQVKREEWEKKKKIQKEENKMRKMRKKKEDGSQLVV